MVPNIQGKHKTGVLLLGIKEGREIRFENVSHH